MGLYRGLNTCYGGLIMKRKDMEKAAKKQLKGIVPCEWNQEPFIDIFVRATEWRINSAWHDVSEIPEKKLALVEYDCFPKGHGYLVVPDAREVIGSITRWAYIEDLIPMED